MSCTGGTSDGTATAGRPSARNGPRIDLRRPQSFPRSLASRIHQAVLALLNTGSLFFVAACGGGTPAPPGETPPQPPLPPVPPVDLLYPPRTVLIAQDGARTRTTPR